MNRKKLYNPNSMPLFEELADEADSQMKLPNFSEVYTNVLQKTPGN